MRKKGKKGKNEKKKQREKDIDEMYEKKIGKKKTSIIGNFPQTTDTRFLMKFFATKLLRSFLSCRPSFLLDVDDY